MNEDTRYQPVEPTTPVPYPYGIAQIAPPPPPESFQRKRRIAIPWYILVLCVMLALVVLGEGVAYYTSLPKPTVTPVVIPTGQSYTAQDILNEMIAHNLPVGGAQYGLSLTHFYGDGLYANATSTPFQSSVTWDSTGSGFGNCADSCSGLWVYSSHTIALTVHQELVADGALAMQTPTQGPTLYPDDPAYGRCIADHAGASYIAVIQQYCT